MKNHIILILMMAGLLWNVSCRDNKEVNNNVSVDLFDFAWGTSLSDIQEAVREYNPKVEGQILYVDSYMKDCLLSYEFTEEALSSFALVKPYSLFTEEEMTGYTSGYVKQECNKPNEQLFANKNKNRILSVRVFENDGKKYCALGWTKLK